MKNFILKYFRKISGLPFFRFNDFKANLIFVLGILLFFVILEDLEKEFAKEKNEIGFFTATLSESVDSVTLGLIEIKFYNPPLTGFISIELIEYVLTIKFDSPTGRSPPLS